MVRTAAAGRVGSAPQDALALPPAGDDRGSVAELGICQAPNALAEFVRLPFRAWCRYDSAGPLRFYALRAHFIDALKWKAKT